MEKISDYLDSFGNLLDRRDTVLHLLRRVDRLIFLTDDERCIVRNELFVDLEHVENEILKMFDLR